MRSGSLVRVVLLAVGLLAGLSLSAVASQPADELSGVERGGPRPPGFDPSTMPFAGGRGMEQLVDDLRRQEERAKERKLRLESPELRAEREESKAEFVGVSDAEARVLVEDVFAEELEGARAGLSLADMADGRPVKEFLDDHTVVLAGGGGRPPLLVESPWPVRAMDDDGRRRSVDLSLEREGGGFSPVNAAAEVKVPGELSEGLQVGPVDVVPAGTGEGELSGKDGEWVIYANAQTDTDVIVAPVATGVEVFWQLRSPRAPEELTLDLGLPEGAVAQESGIGSVVVTKAGKRMTTVSPPVATDAQGQDVMVDMTVRGAQLVLSVSHRDADLAWPVLVDPVIEDYWDPANYGSWYDQDPWALDRLDDWWHWYNGVPFGTYIPSVHCDYLTPCDAAIGHPEYDEWEPDGLHVYVPSGTSFPAGSAGQWNYSPPGTTTRIADAGFYAFYHRRGGNQSPVMFTGIWRATNPDWVSLAHYTQDLAYATITHSGGAVHPGPQQLVFGFWAPSTATNGSWRDGYVGAATIALTDPEGPTVTEARLGGGVTSRGAFNWVSDSGFDVTPVASDPGLGVYHFRLSGPGVDEQQFETLDCTGVRSDPCPSSATGQPLEASTATVQEGVNAYEVRAIDPIWNLGTRTFNVNVDRQRPDVPEPTGTLWDGREQPQLAPNQPVLSPGSHSISVTANDPPPGGAPPGLVRSGVEQLEIRVDGVTEATTNVQGCMAGNCSLSLNWSYKTIDFGGRHKIEIVATDAAGNVGRRAFMVNAPALGELVLPVDPESTSSRIALQAKANQDGFTGVEFQYRRSPIGAWTSIGTFLTDDRGVPANQATHLLSEPDRHTKKLIWDVRSVLNALVPKADQIQVRAVFQGNGGFKSQVANVRLDEKGLSADNAEEAIGPGSVDLLTGNFSYAATDASLSSYGPATALARTYNSLDPNANPNGPYGPGWVASAPVDGVSDYSSLVVLKDATTFDWVDVFDSAGKRIRFERLTDATFKPEVGFEALTLAKLSGPDRYTLTDLDGTVTTFTLLAGTSKFVPSKVEQAGSQGVTSYSYESYLGEPRLKRVIAPAPASVDCSGAVLAKGCRALELNYVSLPTGTRVGSISHIAYDALWHGMKTETVASFSYDARGRLEYAWDPRISPALKERYEYNDAFSLSTVTPPGQAPWSIAYDTAGGASQPGKLMSVKRTAQSSGEASWRMAWNVPLLGAQAPYPMAATNLDGWGQTDRPTDATAILPPDQVGGGYSRASVYYLNQDGRVVNTASPGGRISTSEYDPKGNVLRELSAANRAKALGIGGGSATLAGLLSTYRTYSADGLELLEELGPEHEVRLDSGQVVDARAHTVTTYDEGSTLEPPAKPAHLPTTVRVGARVEPSDPDVDVRTTKTEYDWSLRKPTKTVVDAVQGGLNITRETKYDAAGLEVESRMPKSSGTDAGTTKTTYYTDGELPSEPDCANRPEWFNLPCKSMPAAQPGTAGLPELPVTTFTYDYRQQVLTQTESVGSARRITTTDYDAAGRKQSESTIAGHVGGNPGVAGLVAAYGFEEDTGTAVTDSSGKGNAGTVAGATRTAFGKYGRALDFDGVNDSVVVADANSLDVTTGLTLSAWIKPQTISGPRQKLVTKERGTDSAYHLDANGTLGRPSATLHRSDSAWFVAYGTAPLPNDQWKHLTGTWDGQVVKLYIDGSLVSSKAMTGTPFTSTGVLRIGAANATSGVSDYFDGLIDEVRIYDRALSQAEVQADRDASVFVQTGYVGEPVADVTYGYSSTTGRPTTITTGASTLTTGYDDVGRPTSYTDADGTTSTTSYDNLDRPTTTNDGKGTQTRTYDASTGLLSTLVDSHAGTFTATYDQDGRLTSKAYPNGMKADTIYDEAGSPVRLTYTKTTNCSSDCTWIDEQVSESIHGQWRTHDWDLSSQEYTYDPAGRLAGVEDDVHAPTAVAGCTIRSYSFDANSNRTAMLTKAPAAGGACDPAAQGTQKTYSYDTADRLTATGVHYDPFGRTVQIPTQHSGGGVLSYSYYTNDQVRTISQDEISKTYTLDPASRQRKSIASGGTTHTETLHYQDATDSPSWTRVVNTQGQEVSWDRTIEGIDGDLAAIRTHDSQGDKPPSSSQTSTATPSPPPPPTPKPPPHSNASRPTSSATPAKPTPDATAGSAQNNAAPSSNQASSKWASAAMCRR